MSENNLRPCPFCGSDGAWLERIEPHTHTLNIIPDHPGSAVVECVCGCGVMCATDVDAVKFWNHRPAEDSLTARISTLEAALDMKDQLNEALRNENAALHIQLTKAHKMADETVMLYGLKKTENEKRRKELEALQARLGQAEKNALKWVVYDGGEETLPELEVPVLLKATMAEYVSVHEARLDDAGLMFWYPWIFAEDEWYVTTGDRWAYLPTVEEK